MPAWPGPTSGQLGHFGRSRPQVGIKRRCQLFIAHSERACPACEYSKECIQGVGRNLSACPTLAVSGTRQRGSTVLAASVPVAWIQY